VLLWLLQEEKYITYILDDDGANMEVHVSPATSAPGVIDDRAVSPSSEERVDSLHRCTQCMYSSPYKANVLRHAKIAHSPREAEEVTVNGSSDKATTRSMPSLDDDDISQCLLVITYEHLRKWYHFKFLLGSLKNKLIRIAFLTLNPLIGRNKPSKRHSDRYQLREIYGWKESEFLNIPT
jgi:hypothetical protein